MNAKLVVIGASLLSLFGCGSTPQKTSDTPVTQNSTLNNAAAVEVDAHSFIEISFSKGSSTLTDASKAAIRNLIAQKRSFDEIDEIMVMSWADLDYPSVRMEELSVEQRDLASRRNKAVEAYVKSQRDLDVDAYNMAERPGALSRLFNTTDNRLKKSLVSAGLPTTAGSSYPSKASRSVVFMKIK